MRRNEYLTAVKNCPDAAALASILGRTDPHEGKPTDQDVAALDVSPSDAEDPNDPEVIAAEQARQKAFLTLRGDLVRTIGAEGFVFEEEGEEEESEDA